MINDMMPLYLILYLENVICFVVKIEDCFVTILQSSLANLIQYLTYKYINITFMLSITIFFLNPYSDSTYQKAMLIKDSFIGEKYQNIVTEDNSLL